MTTRVKTDTTRASGHLTLAHSKHNTLYQEIIMQKRKYRVPLSVAATASATFFVEAGSLDEAVAVARVQLLGTGRVYAQPCDAKVWRRAAAEAL